MRLLGSGSFPALEDYKFAPFSVGKRYCPGADMAKRQLLLEAVRLIHAFHWAPQPGSRVNLEGKFGLTYEAPAQELLCTARHPTAAVKE
jgi:cytochrome P450